MFGKNTNMNWIENIKKFASNNSKNNNYPVSSVGNNKNHTKRFHMLFPKWNWSLDNDTITSKYKTSSRSRQHRERRPDSQRISRDTPSTSTSWSLDLHESEEIASPISRSSCYSDSFSSIATNKESPILKCPSCGLRFGPGIRRKLVDASCGHERCYECMFANENCAECSHVQLRRRFKKRPGENELQQQESPNSNRSSGRGRESGFQSYLSINSSIQDKEEVFLDEEMSETSSVISLMSTVTTSRNGNQFRRSIPNRRSVGSNYSSSEKSFGSRNGLTRRSYCPPRSNRFTEMSAILENTLSSCQDDHYEMLGPVPEPSQNSTSAITRNIADETSMNKRSSEAAADPHFVGRKWVFRSISETFSSDLPTNQGIVIVGGAGTGKTSLINYLINSGPFAKELTPKLIAYFHCQKDQESKGLASHFVHELINQTSEMFSSNFPKRSNFDKCCDNPSEAFKQDFLKPLLEMRKRQSQLYVSSISDYYVIAVDGLENSDFFPTDPQRQSVARFLETHSSSMPNWIKVILTVRQDRVGLVKELPFQKISLDDNGFDERVSKDVRDFISFRMKSSEILKRNSTPTSWKYEMNPQAVLTDYLVELSKGSMLYVKSVLDLLQNDKLVIKSSNFTVLPQTMSEVYNLRLSLLFPTQTSFELTRKIFSACLATLRRFNLTELYETVCALEIESYLTKNEFDSAWENISEFLPQKSGTVFFFHDSFRDWLLQKSHKFSCDTNLGHTAIALRLSRQSANLNANETLDLGHHLLKAQLFSSTQIKAEKEEEEEEKDENNFFLNGQETRALVIAYSSESPSQSLATERNLMNPNEGVTRLLLEAKASPNFRLDDKKNDRYISSPLLNRFVARGHEKMVETLIEFGADVTATNSRGITPLMLATSSSNNNKDKVVSILLSHNNSILNQASNDGRTPLSFAATSGSTSVLRFLLEQPWPSKGCVRELSVQEALISSIRSIQAESLKVLMSDRDASLNSPCLLTHEMPLEAAIKAGNVELLQMLVNGGAELARISYPLHCAIEQGHLDMTRILISLGCETSRKDTSGKSPLVLACCKGNLEIVTLLLTMGGCSANEKDSKGTSGLSWACLKGQTKVAEHLLQLEEVDVNDKDESDGRTALHYAAMSGHTEIVAMLLKNGADVESTDKNGIRPIDQAVSTGNRDCVSCFLRKGAKLGPTTWAMVKGKPAILLLLLNKLLEDGNKLHLNERLDEAIYRYEYALKKLPSDLNNKEIFVQLRIHLLLNLSRTKRKRSEFKSAMERACQVLELRSDSSEALWCRAKARYEMLMHSSGGVAKTKRKDLLEETITDLREAIKICPQNEMVHKFASKVRQKLREIEFQESLNELEEDRVIY